MHRGIDGPWKLDLAKGKSVTKLTGASARRDKGNRSGNAAFAAAHGAPA
jgi:hypothetical protein